MDAVQAPIVAVVGDLIRQVPGTISLGQGVVHYGPPQAAVNIAREAMANPDTHCYQDGAGNPALLGAIAHKLQRDNGINVARGSRVTVTAGGNMAFVHAVLAITNPGDEVILPVPFYFNHEMAIQIAGCTPVPVATDERFQLDLDVIRDAVTPRTRAIVTVSPNNPTGAVYPEAALRAVNRALPGARDPSHQRRGLRVLHLRDDCPRVTGRVRRRPLAHDLAVFAVESLRLRRLAHRLHGVSRVAGERGRQGAGHGAGVPAGDLAGGGGGGNGSRPCVLPPTPPAPGRDSRHRRSRSCDRSSRSARCRRPTARSTVSSASMPTSTR